ncbi:hypothetical protein Fot_03810 [Forsythia ovata]|uniref:Uncharacterized protein n=1 Tax=Forsythia ovata TaxID=205694 RepID=A0ABD1XBD6_9LAMI
MNFELRRCGWDTYCEWLFLTIAPCAAAEPWQLGSQDIPLMTLLIWKIFLGIPYRARQSIILIMSCSPPISECEPYELRVEKKTSHLNQLANQMQAKKILQDKN